MPDRFPKAVEHVVEAVCGLAAKDGLAVYLVGGFVRDLLLGTANNDLDIVVEGDGIEFAGELSAKLGGKLSVYRKYMTAAIILPDGEKIDVATARVERYAYPAALPEVTASSIKNDLARRDFSINAMAIRLDGASPRAVIDYHDGQADLKSGVLRVLHDRSFLDDPTRVIRAIRFESRDFTIEEHTASLLNEAVRRGLLNALSPRRLFAELKLILMEKQAAAALRRMSQLGLLKFTHSYPGFDESVEKLLERH